METIPLYTAEKRLEFIYQSADQLMELWKMADTVGEVMLVGVGFDSLLDTINLAASLDAVDVLDHLDKKHAYGGLQLKLLTNQYRNYYLEQLIAHY